MDLEKPKNTKEVERFLDDERQNTQLQPQTHPGRRRSHCHWILLTGLNLLIATVSLCSYTQITRKTHGPVWETDILDAHDAIQYEERTYTGALGYDYEKKEMIREPDGEVEYFGPPGPAVDAAWHDLLRGESPRHPMTQSSRTAADAISKDNSPP